MKRDLRIPTSDLAIGIYVAIGIFVVLLIRYRWLLDGPVYFGGDEGNQFGIGRDAVLLRELRGGGSRTGFHHPGPAYLWIWGLADVARTVLHLPVGHDNAQMLGADVAVAVQLSAVAMLVRAHLGSIVQGLVVLVALAALALDPGLIGGPWLPHMYYVTFVLLVAAGASVAAGRLASIPIFVFAAALLVHGHIAFTSFTGVATFALLIVMWRRKQFRQLWVEQRRIVWWTVGILAVFAAPIVVYTLTSWPGEFGLYFKYLRDPGTGNNALKDSIRYTMQFWPGSSTMVRSLGAATAMAALVAASWWRRSQFGFSLAVGVILMELCLLQYAISGVDDLSYRYAGIWAYALPGLVVGVAAALVLPAAVTKPTAWPGWVALGVMAVVGWCLVTVTTGLTYVPVDYTSTPAAVDRVEDAADGREVIIDADLDDIGAYLQIPALLNEAEDRGLDVCFADPVWETKYGTPRLCTADQLADGTVFTFFGTQEPLPDAARGSDVEKYQSAYIVIGAVPGG